jgi:hypothetical protein
VLRGEIADELVQSSHAGGSTDLAGGGFGGVPVPGAREYVPDGTLNGFGLRSSGAEVHADA